MYIPEFVCGIQFTICAELALIILYSVFRKGGRK